MSNDLKTFEEYLDRVTQISDILSLGEAPLDETLKLYREANELLSKAKQLLTEAEVTLCEINSQYKEEG